MAFSCVLLATLMGTVTSKAYAASDYDSFLNVTPTLYAYTDGPTMSAKIDLSTTWLSEFEQTYEKRVVAHPSWSPDFMNELNDIMSEGGSWGVYAKRVSGLGIQIGIVGTRDPDGFCQFNGPAATGTFACSANPGYGFITTDYFTHNSFGYNGCGGSTCSQKGMNTYAEPNVVTSTGGGAFLTIPNTALDDFEFYFMNFDINYPVGYQGEMIPTSQPGNRYVAMGDSYSSGEGNLPYDYGSDTMANVCHRSSNAYPRQLQEDLDLNPMVFSACSGAVSEYVIDSANQENPELPQAVYVSDATELVTMTMGGNDAQFVPAIRECLASTVAQDCLDALATSSAIVNSTAFESNLEEIYEGVKSFGNTDTQIMVIGYPRLFAPYDDIAGTCTWGDPVVAAFTDVLSGRTITEDELDALAELQSDLNQAISNAVTATMDSDISFIDPTAAFSGHELCGAQTVKYINEISLSVNTGDLFSGSFHPNQAGQDALASLVGVELS